MGRIYYKGIQLEQIRSFCRVARLGSFVAVAAELGLSAPTVWRQVRALERECQSRLLVRKGRSVQLTSEGKLGDLTEWPWIMPARETQPRRHLEEVLRREGLREKIRVVLESRSFSLTQTYVALGLGISLWYGGNPRKPAPGLWVRPATQWF